MSSAPTVLITETLDDVPARWLSERATLLWRRHDDPDLSAALAQADALVVRTYTQVNDALLDLAPRVKVVGRAGVGLDNVDLDACRRRGIPVVYTPDANTQAVVEYVLGLMLDVHRPRTAMPDRCDAKAFHALRKTEVGTQLDQLTLGILGFGRIGKRLGKVAAALGIRTLVNDILPPEELRRLVDYDVTFVDKPTLYRQSDILSVHVDGRPENRHLIDAAALALLKPTCLFINAARGMLVDSAALADWARAHPQARVVLDVHEPEPPPSDYPLFGLPQAKLLPHLASRTDPALQNMSWVVRDIWAVLQGEKPKYPAP